MVEPAGTGGWLLRSPLKPHPYPPTLLHALKKNAESYPDRMALSEQAPESLRRTVSFGEFWQMTKKVSEELKSACKGEPLMILSGNSIEHAVIRYAAMAAGIPAAPVSPGYSLLARSYEKLKHVIDVCQPGAIFVQDTAPFEAALNSLQERAPVIAVADAAGWADISYSDWVDGNPDGSTLDPDIDAIDIDSPAQVMFTSGSTGMPKAVIHTHSNLVANLVQTQQVLSREYDGDDCQAIASWLPWHHVSGANSLQLSLFCGYSHYLDHGRPIPGQEQPTLDILKEVSVSFYVNVPLGYAMLIDAFERDRGLAENFFKSVRFMIYGGAGIAAETMQRFDRLSADIKGVKVPFISAYGSTETSGSITFTYFDADATGLIGLPVPGVEIKLVPCHGKFELRVRGGSVTPGYIRGNDGVFDDAGFLKVGDLVEWVDEDDFNKGLKFAGRVAEEFKLASGTWVAASSLRLQLVDLVAPLIQEAVICGSNRESIGALVWLNGGACLNLDSDFDADRPWRSKIVIETIRSAVARHNELSPGSSTHINRIKLMNEALSAENGEISDKGSVNSRLVLSTRSACVDRLYGTDRSEYLAISEKSK